MIRFRSLIAYTVQYQNHISCRVKHTDGNYYGFSASKDKKYFNEVTLEKIAAFKNASAAETTL